MERKIIQTNDGSSSIFVPELNEHYHSIHGAKNEAEHVFIQMGLDKLCAQKNTINILEIGLGTGLNASLTLQKAQKEKLIIQYHAIEKYPIEKIEFEALNYMDFLNPDDFKFIFNSPWNEIIHYPKYTNFSLHKHQCDVSTFNLFNQFDLIYFDAFAPNKQPRMWDKSVFQLMFSCLKNNGLLTTYCSKGDVKRTLQYCGFVVEKVAGPPGKREMLNAWKKSHV